MAQHDYNISNQSGAAFRADLNNALAAIVSNNSGAVEPSTTYAYQFWADTTAGVLKQRNAANSAWVTLFQLDGEWTTIALENGTGAAPSLYFKDSGTDTGLYSPGVDQVGVATAGVQRVNFNGATEVVFNDTGADVDFRIEGDTEPNLFVVDAGTDEVRVKNLNGGPLAGARNRIINGDMRIDQRNNGTAVTIPATTLTYVMDRWAAYEDTDGVISVQRVAEAPTGFINSAKVTVTTADTSLAATQSATFRQSVEGFNAADLYWGYSGAQTVTLSFWVRSSLTGTFAGAISNSDNTRSYPFTYAISAANTWEYKTVTIPGDTTGTWGTNTAIGIAVLFNLGTGSTYTGTAGAWVGTNIVSVTGSVNLIGTLNATWQITGVQLEPGSVATPFERRSHGQELALCQRYYQAVPVSIRGTVASGGRLANHAYYKTSMRAAPTLTATGTITSSNVTSESQGEITVEGFRYDVVPSTANVDSYVTGRIYLASAEL